MVKPIRVLALDIDGVLTDGTAALGTDGTEDKRFCFQDLDAVGQARRLGVTVVLVTAEDGPAVDLIADRFGVDDVARSAKDKLAALSSLAEKLGTPLSDFCYVGDADRDAPALARVGLAFAPANATLAAKAAADRVLDKAGGQGAVAEAVHYLKAAIAEPDATSSYGSEMAATIEESVEAHQRMLEESPETLARIAATFIAALKSGHKILLFGNGGSAADAQHVAGELVGRFTRESEPWPAIALTTDTSILTAVGNDWSFDEIFSRQVQALARHGDVVVGISTSGRSANVVNGLEAGRMSGATTIAFVGASGGPVADKADWEFHAPANTTPRIQELHLLAWHSICEIVERRMMDYA